MNMRPGPSAWPPGNSPGRTYRFSTLTPVFTFGYGLSYTTFTYTPAAAVAEVALPSAGPRVTAAGEPIVSLAPVRQYVGAHSRVAGAAFAPLDSATVVNYWVNVTNTGTIDAGACTGGRGGGGSQLLGRPTD
jgi:hypothetical protein